MCRAFFVVCSLSHRERDTHRVLIAFYALDATIKEQGVFVKPVVFQLPKVLSDNKLVSVMMPFDKSFEEVFLAIRESCEIAELKCQRVDGLWEDSVVMQDVFSLIYRSRVVVVDFSTRNPNVYYETGIAHTLGKPVVPIAQSEHDVPFDLRHHRYLRYLSNGEGLKKLTEKLADRLRTLSQE
jgi:hypothetical protein